MTNQQHIILIGFMGAGKSTVGKALASQLKISFIDIDEEIVKREGRSIPEIFNADSEMYFRKVETKTLYTVLQSLSPVVISTGGGIILSEENQSIIKQHHTILLNASIDEIYNRIKENSKERPLLQQSDQNLKRRLTELYSSRQSVYQQLAELVIDTNNKDITKIVNEIIEYKIW